jgi:predicted permease
MNHAQPFMNLISPGYFGTLGVSIVAGRDFTVNDNREVRNGPNPDDWSQTVAMINEKFAAKYFPGRNPVGMHIGFGTDPGKPTFLEVVGVVKDIKYTNLRDEISVQAYVPYLGSHFVGGMTVYVRTTSDANLLMNAVRGKVHELDANLPIYEMRTTEAQISNSLTTERMIASLTTVFGLLATLLATIGLYGVMAYTVAQRTREIGIRMALGAEQGNVVWMVMRDVLLLIAIGVGAGVPAALAVTRLVQSQLYGLTPHDPQTLALATGALVVVACAAGCIPALRASRLDPMAALRYE